jgi:antitoxin HicB
MRNEELERYVALPYRFECRFDPEDKVYVIRYPELPGCVAHGKTVREAQMRGEQFKEEWLETALENNQKIPVPQPEPQYSGKLLVRLPVGLHAQIARDAAAEDVSINVYIVQAIAEKVQRTGIKNLFNESIARFKDFAPAEVYVAWGDSIKKLTPEKAASLPSSRSLPDNGK